MIVWFDRQATTVSGGVSQIYLIWSWFARLKCGNFECFSTEIVWWNEIAIQIGNSCRIHWPSLLWSQRLGSLWMLAAIFIPAHNICTISPPSPTSTSRRKAGGRRWWRPPGAWGPGWRRCRPAPAPNHNTGGAHAHQPKLGGGQWVRLRRVR